MAIDCEMVETMGVRNSLARVSIVDQNSHVILDEFVVPPGGYVVDYRTRYSGITKEIIDQKGQDMSAALERVQEVLKDAVVIGHTVNTDLDSLRECPCRAIVDISENSMLKLLYWRTVNTEDPDTDEEIIRRPRVSLKKLSTTLLDRNIQQGKKGHSSVEDAQATMDLFKVIQKRWEQTNPDLAGDNLFNDRYWDEEESISTDDED